MPLTLHIDSDRWRDHLRSTWNADIIPVAKGNGYGVGNPRLLAESRALGAKTVAVGTYNEVPPDSKDDVVVLSPWRSFLEVPQGKNVIHTVSRLADLVSIPAGSRVLIEVQTSMRRHGIGARELRHTMLLNALDRIKFEGWSLHFPMGAGGTSANIREAAELGKQARAVRQGPLWVSHVPAQKLADIGESVKLRMGTALWLGDRGAFDRPRDRARRAFRTPWRAGRLPPAPGHRRRPHPGGLRRDRARRRSGGADRGRHASGSARSRWPRAVSTRPGWRCRRSR